MARPDLRRALASTSDDAADRVLARAFWHGSEGASRAQHANVVPLVRPDRRPGS